MKINKEYLKDWNKKSYKEKELIVECIIQDNSTDSSMEEYERSYQSIVWQIEREILFASLVPI